MPLLPRYSNLVLPRRPLRLAAGAAIAIVITVLVVTILLAILSTAASEAAPGYTGAASNFPTTVDATEDERPPRLN